MTSTDLRYALRRLVQAPAYASAVIVMLALGIAVSATMFAVLSGVLGNLPFPDAKQLVKVETESAERGVSRGGLTPAEALRLEEEDSPFASVAYFNWGGMTVFSEDRPRELTIAVVNPDFFRTFGMQPALGRWFAPDEHAAESGGVILSHAEWQRLLGGRSDAVGSVIDTSLGRLQVVGIMPPEFSIPSRSVGAWRPLPASAFPVEESWVSTARYLDVFARIDARIDASQRSQRLARFSEDVQQRHAISEVWQFSEFPLLELYVGNVRGLLWGGLGIALLVLLVACANAAILIDARQTLLRPQNAVLQALGASRGRLLRDLLIEIGMLTLLALLAGALLANLSVDLLRELARGSLPRVDAISIDARVWVFTAALGLLLPLVAALGGSLRLRGDAGESMRAMRGVLSAHRRRPWLPAVGVALSTAAVVAGSALLVSLWQLSSVDPGLRHQGVYAMQLFRAGDADARRDFAATVAERLKQLPGVDAVAVANAAPPSVIGNWEGNIRLPGQEQVEPFLTRVRSVSPGYLELLDIPLLEGRSISSEDRAGSERVAVISQGLATRLFGAESALGRHLELPIDQGGLIAHRIVGIKADTLNRGLREVPRPEALVPHAAAPPQSITFMVRAPAGLANPEAVLGDALFAIDPRQATTRIFALSDDFNVALAPARFFARSFGAVALVALLLAAFGVHAVASLRQRQRVAEFGLRLAIGARPRTLALQSLRESLRLVLTGLAVGLLGAWAALHLLRSQLFGLEGSEPLVVALGLLLLCAASLLAALAPAMRAARTDPMTALRES